MGVNSTPPTLATAAPSPASAATVTPITAAVSKAAAAQAVPAACTPTPRHGAAPVQEHPSLVQFSAKEGFSPMPLKEMSPNTAAYHGSEQVIGLPASRRWSGLVPPRRRRTRDKNPTAPPPTIFEESPGVRYYDGVVESVTQSVYDCFMPAASLAFPCSLEPKAAAAVKKPPVPSKAVSFGAEVTSAKLVTRTKTAVTPVAVAAAAVATPLAPLPMQSTTVVVPPVAVATNPATPPTPQPVELKPAPALVELAPQQPQNTRVEPPSAQQVKLAAAPAAPSQQQHTAAAQQHTLRRPVQRSMTSAAFAWRLVVVAVTAATMSQMFDASLWRSDHTAASPFEGLLPTWQEPARVPVQPHAATPRPASPASADQHMCGHSTMSCISAFTDMWNAAPHVSRPVRRAVTAVPEPLQPASASPAEPAAEIAREQPHAVMQQPVSAPSMLPATAIVAAIVAAGFLLSKNFFTTPTTITFDANTDADTDTTQVQEGGIDDAGFPEPELAATASAAAATAPSPPAIYMEPPQTPEAMPAVEDGDQVTCTTVRRGRRRGNRKVTFKAITPGDGQDWAAQKATAATAGSYTAMHITHKVGEPVSATPVRRSRRLRKGVPTADNRRLSLLVDTSEMVLTTR